MSESKIVASITIEIDEKGMTRLKQENLNPIQIVGILGQAVTNMAAGLKLPEDKPKVEVPKMKIIQPN